LRIVVVFVVTAALLTAAALAGGADPARPIRPAASADEPTGSGVQAVAIKNEAVFSVRLSSGGFGDQSELDPDDELFDAISASDLPAPFRRQATIQGFRMESYPRVGGGVDMVWLSTSHDEAFLAFADLTESELESLGVRPLAEAGATLHLAVTVARSATDADARALATIPDVPDDGELILLLREYEDEIGVDVEDLLLDGERTYVERRREPMDVSSLGDGATGERTVVAVLDYDEVANAYRSDRVLRWEFTENIVFAVGPYAVSVNRTSASLQDEVPNDVDPSALGQLVAGRLEETIVP
jgi:hypothetical protein